jgi:SAM-dependent methyltransferase
MGSVELPLDQSFLDIDAIAAAEVLRRLHQQGEDVRSAALAELEKYKFYHSITILPDLKTSGLAWAASFQQAFYSAVENIDFSDKRVLDVGCRDGAMLLHAEAQGARELIGVDSDPSPGLANFIIPFRGSKIRVYGANVYDLTPMLIGTFDIVIGCGLLYHLRYPMLGIKRLADLLVDGGILVMETALIDALGDLPVLFNPLGDQSPFESSSPTFFNLAGLANAFGQAALSVPTVLKRFNIGTYDASKFFAEFGTLATEKLARFSVPRTILEARKMPVRNTALEKYFEGRHKYHSTGSF